MAGNLNRRRGWDEGGKEWLLVAALLASMAAQAAGWTAYADKAAMPTISGTSLRNDLLLPELVSGNVDFCVIAKTTFDKAALVCGMSFSNKEPDQCPLRCGASWHSALRDAYAIMGSSCLPLENAYNEIWGPPDAISSTGTFTQSEWEEMKRKCTTICGERWCDYSSSDAAMSMSLYPPQAGAEGCPDLVATDGTYSYPFLTWNSVMYYQSNALGCTGGLSEIADDEFSTWACVHSPQCEAIIADDLACYKYNKMRGEFIFWGWNARLKLAPALFQMPASFCNDDGDSVLLNARLPVGAGISIAGAIYSFYMVEIQTGALKLFRYGSVTDLSDLGCGPVRLAPDTKYWLEVSLQGSQYYQWKGWWSSLNDDILRGNPQEISLAMYPKLAERPGFYGCDWLGVTLQWCTSDPLDLDLYMFVPDVEGGDFVLDEAHAVYWANQIGGRQSYTGPLMQNGGEENGGATIILERDDEGSPPGGGPRTFGPESIIIKGTLMPGKYGIFVAVWINDPLSPLVFSGGCATVGVYSGNNPTGLVDNLVVGAKGKNGFWWHAANIIVEDAVAPPDVFPSEMGNLQDSGGRSRRVISTEIVDKIVTGPVVQYPSGAFGEPRFGEPGIPLSGRKKVYRRELVAFNRSTQPAQWVAAQHCRIYSRIGLKVFSATTSLPVDGAQFLPTGASELIEVGQALLVNNGPLGYSGGYFTLEGIHSWEIQGVGHAEYRLDFTIGIGVDHLFFAAFMLPADGKTRVVLRWGDTPSDNDLYVRPVGVVHPDTGEEAVWAWRDRFSADGDDYPPAVYEEGQSPYLFWNVAAFGCDGCICECVDFDGDPETPCEPMCQMSVLDETEEDTPRLKLDRDDQIHGTQNGEDLMVYNAPEVATFENLWPGIYRVYVNAYPPDGESPVFTSQVDVDIYLGDGETVGLIDTVTLRAGRGGRWLYAGYIAVTDESESTCILPNQAFQKPPARQLCYTWYNINRVVFNPLPQTNVPVRLRLSHAVYQTQQYDQYGISFGAASYIVHQGGSCSCIGVIQCSCQGSTVITSGRIGQPLGEDTFEGIEGFYTPFLPIYLTNGQYSVIVRLNGYYDRLITFAVANNQPVDAFGMMVPVVASGQLRVVLSWGGRPYDLDLYVMRKTDPLPGWDKIVYWDQRTAPVPSGGIDEMRGIQLDRDWVSGYGPETVTFGTASRALSWHVAVNVYTDMLEYEADYFQCFPTLDDTCHFFGGETVEFYTSTGLITSATHPELSPDGPTSNWWRVAAVEKDIAGNYNVDLGVQISDGTARCSDVMYQECVDIFEAR